MASPRKSKFIEPELTQLRLGRKKGYFKFSFRWKSSLVSPELQKEESFWFVSSNVKETSLLKFLKLKLFLSTETHIQVLRLLSDHPKVLNDQVFVTLFKHKMQNNLDILTILERYEGFCQVFGKANFYKKELLKQWENNIGILAQEAFIPIRPFKPYSGYVRNSSSVGSKRKSNFLFLESEVEEMEISNENDFLDEAITVGEVSSCWNSISISLMKNLKGSKRSLTK